MTYRTYVWVPAPGNTTNTPSCVTHRKTLAPITFLAFSASNKGYVSRRDATLLFRTVQAALKIATNRWLVWGTRESSGAIRVEWMI